MDTISRNNRTYSGKKRGPKPKPNKKIGYSTKFSPEIERYVRGQENQSLYLENLIQEDIRRRSRWITTDDDSSTVSLSLFGAIPVVVEYSVYRAEPDVGVMEAGIDDWEIIEAPYGILKDELMEFINELELKNAFSMEDAIKEA